MNTVTFTYCPTAVGTLFTAHSSLAEKHASLYQYDANGERTYKLTGQYRYQNINGRYYPYAVLDNPTLYASPYVVCTPKDYTKHYYAESERVASKIGNGCLRDLCRSLNTDADFNKEDEPENPYLKDCDEENELLFEKQERNCIYSKNVMACLESENFIAEKTLEGLYSRIECVEEGEDECYWYHPDHLGSSSWITFTDGKAVQHLHYLPWGEDFVDQRLTSWSARYAFSAKERDVETGLSYFGARYYSSDLSIWLSVDPMVDKYPHQSNYVYCSNNPLKVIDPNGEDEWEIDGKGNLKWSKVNKEIDILYSTKTRQSMEFPVGTINEMSKDMGIVNYDRKNITVDFQYLDINDDDLASCFFEFVAENTEIEWSLIQTGTNGNHISRDSQYRDQTGKELELNLANASGTCLLKRFLDNNVSIRASKHSHPFVVGRNIVPEPSGYDMGVKTWFLDKYKELANFKYEAYGKKDGCWQYMPY